jgi:hypothetical protein
LVDGPLIMVLLNLSMAKTKEENNGNFI